jgi:thioredoxin reductase
MSRALPVVVIGAGPIGLAAAAHLLRRGIEPLVLEAGPSVASNVRAWGHVQIFSPWRYNIDAAARELLEAHGWKEPPAEEHPTGQELIELYLDPLAQLPEIAPRLRFGTRVVAVARSGGDKLRSFPERDAAPFVVRVLREGSEAELLARAVIDASGTFQTPNPLGGHGLPAIGERELKAHIAYGIPDVAGADRARYAGRRVLVVGSGHSAFNVLLDLAALAAEAPESRVLWAVRRKSLERVFGGGERDQLPERGRLGRAVQSLAGGGRLEVFLGFLAVRMRRTAEGIVVESGERSLPPVDEIVVATGFRPELEMLRELRLDLDPVLEAPVALAPLIDPNLHSCGTVRPHGAEQLAHPEAGFYLVGMKSYGRAPTFLMRTGYEQVRSVAAALAGDLEGAREVRLMLPETGVCRLDLDPGTAHAAPAASAQAAAAADAGSRASGACSAKPAAGPQVQPWSAGRTYSGKQESLEPVQAAAVPAASGCCGGPATENSSACCKLDEEKKAGGEAGCGCNSGFEPVAAALPLQAACC